MLQRTTLLSIIALQCATFADSGAAQSLADYLGDSHKGVYEELERLLGISIDAQITQIYDEAPQSVLEVGLQKDYFAMKDDEKRYKMQFESTSKFPIWFYTYADFRGSTRRLERNIADADALDIANEVARALGLDLREARSSTWRDGHYFKVHMTQVYGGYECRGSFLGVTILDDGQILSFLHTPMVKRLDDTECTLNRDQIQECVEKYLAQQGGKPTEVYVPDVPQCVGRIPKDLGVGKSVFEAGLDGHLVWSVRTSDGDALTLDCDTGEITQALRLATGQSRPPATPSN
jgi:hypothetical protein